MADGTTGLDMAKRRNLTERYSEREVCGKTDASGDRERDGERCNTWRYGLAPM
jgi:hypothetical protein